MRTLLFVVLLATPASADWWDGSRSGPLENVLDRNDCDHCDEPKPVEHRDFRIIDIEQMKTSDCALAHKKGLPCIIDWFVEDACDYARPILKYRYELVQQILDSAEAAADL